LATASSTNFSTSRFLKDSNLDEIDRMVLCEVGKNARASSLQITRKLRGFGYLLTDRAVRKRLERLEKNKVILRYSAVLDPGLLSNKTHRTLLFKFKHTHALRSEIDRLTSYVNESGFCTYSTKLTGDFDWICHFIFESLEQYELETSNFLHRFKELIADYHSHESYTIKSVPYSVPDAHDQGERQRKVYEILNSLKRFDNLNDRLKSTVESLVSVMGAKFARIWLVDRDRKNLILKFSAGKYTNLHGEFSRIPIGAYKIGEVVTTNKPCVSNDVVHDPRISHHDWAKKQRLRSFAGYPLSYKNKAIGVLAMFSEEQFSPSAFELFELFSRELSKGITSHFEAHELLVGE
jgi:DNA-binding Lrp family transcriptional regulator